MKKLILNLALAGLIISCGPPEGSYNDKESEEDIASLETYDDELENEVMEEVEGEKRELPPETTENKKVVEIVLGSNDLMKFDLSEIKVPANSQVKLTLKHNGKLPKASMGHNFVLLSKGTVIQDFGMQALKSKDNGYIPSGNNVIAHTKLLGGGETDTIIFDAPAAGTYDFICSFPGHYSLMKGKFIVQ